MSNILSPLTEAPPSVTINLLDRTKRIWFMIQSYTEIVLLVTCGLFVYSKGGNPIPMDYLDMTWAEYQPIYFTAILIGIGTVLHLVYRYRTQMKRMKSGELIFSPDSITVSEHSNKRVYKVQNFSKIHIVSDVPFQSDGRDPSRRHSKLFIHETPTPCHKYQYSVPTSEDAAKLAPVIKRWRQAGVNVFYEYK